MNLNDLTIQQQTNVKMLVLKYRVQNFASAFTVALRPTMLRMGKTMHEFFNDPEVQKFLHEYRKAQENEEPLRN